MAKIPTKRTISKPDLCDLYVNQGLPLSKIGEKLGVGIRTVSRWLQKDGVEARPKGATIGQGAGARKKPISKEELERMYLVDGMTQCQIAERYGLSEWAIGKRLHAFGILVRPTNWVRDNPRKNQFTPDDLRRLYVSERRTMKEIAEMYGMNPITVSKWLRRYGIAVEQPWERRAVNLDAGDLRRLYLDEGWTLNRIAKHFSCSMWAVRLNFRRNGITIRGLCERRKGAVLSRTGRADHKGYERETRFAADGGLETVSTHRAMAEEAIGRNLAPSEIVHHINRIKSDNRIENLAILPNNIVHRQVHAYAELVGLFLCKLSPIRPEPLDFGEPVFWGGKYVTCIDLLQGASFASGEPLLDEKPLGKSFKEMLN